MIELMMAADNNFSRFPFDYSAAGLAASGSKPVGARHSDQHGLIVLPEDFVPGNNDVICQRGKDSFEHSGNKRFRDLIEEHIDTYLEAGSRQAKSAIVASIYEHIRKNANQPSSGFVRKDLLTRRWFLVGEKEARDKVGQALRDAIKIIRSSARKDSNPEKVTSSTPDRCRATKRPAANDEARRALDGDDVSRDQSSEIYDEDGQGDARGRAQPLGVDSSCAVRYPATDSPAGGQHMLASRLFENQAPSIGHFPMSTGALNLGNFDDLDGLAMNTMLETSIEPIDKRLGKKRRVSNMTESHNFSSMNTFGYDSMQNPFGFGQDLIQAAKQRQAQISSASGDGFDIRLNPHLHSLAPQFSFGSHAAGTTAGTGNMPLHLMQHPQPPNERRRNADEDGTEATDPKNEGTNPSDCLEPTPFTVRSSSQPNRDQTADQRASALAQLLWPDESNRHFG